MPRREARPASALDETDRLLIQNLRRCSFLPASFDKRFARNVGHIADRTAGELTDRQRSCLNSLVYRYRRQIPAPIVAKAALRLADEQAAYRLAVSMPAPAQPIERASTVVRNPLDDVFATQGSQQ